MKKTLVKTVGNERIYATFSTDGTGVNNPYFSATGRVYIAGRPTTESNLLVCGCVHDEILKAFPEAAFFVSMRLSKIDGVPMHAFENGWYWLAKVCGIKQKYEPEQSAEECKRIFQEHCRTSDIVTNNIIEDVKSRGKAAWHEHYCNLIAVWNRQAEDAIFWLENLKG